MNVLSVSLQIFPFQHLFMAFLLNHILDIIKHKTTEHVTTVVSTGDAESNALQVLPVVAKSSAVGDELIDCVTGVKPRKLEGLLDDFAVVFESSHADGALRLGNARRACVRERLKIEDLVWRTTIRVSCFFSMLFASP